MTFENLLKDLQMDYLASLPEKIRAIGDLALTADRAGLRNVFHNLKGTGRTYGLPEVSELGELLESICARRPEQAITAAGLACTLLSEIHAYRIQNKAFAVISDPRFVALRALLQH
jgi:HPt (histidine-containing phosphotransfer) domain-containing protein